MFNKIGRREFLWNTTQLGTAAVAASQIALPNWFGSGVVHDDTERLFKVSCTQYSLHRLIGSGELDNLDYTAFVKNEFGLDGVEYWNHPFFKKAEDAKYIQEMRKRADDVGVQGLVILIDGEGHLGDPDDKQRVDAVDRHKKWVTCAKELGCHSIRVNAKSTGSYDEQMKLSADGLRRLSEFAAKIDMNVIVENHGGYSSDGKWLASVMEKVGLDNCGTLPDFGNFYDYDRYLGVEELMPFAKSVSAKSRDFDADGNETETDYSRMMKIVVAAGYDGYVGIEYEGGRLSEVEGVHATKKLLDRVHAELIKEKA